MIFETRSYAEKSYLLMAELPPWDLDAIKAAYPALWGEPSSYSLYALLQDVKECGGFAAYEEKRLAKKREEEKRQRSREQKKRLKQYIKDVTEQKHEVDIMRFLWRQWLERVIRHGLKSDEIVLMVKDMIRDELEFLERVAGALDVEQAKRRPDPKPTFNPAGYVYLLRVPDRPGVYKIGRTVNPSNRLQTFSVKLPFEVAYDTLISTADMYALEAELHKRFGDQRLEGSEFFALTDADVAYVRSLANQGEG